MTVDPDLIKKIQKMLDLADPSKNDNANQIEIAMRKAQEFMRAHGLSMADLADTAEGDLEIGVGIWKDEERYDYQGWMKMLAQATAMILGCRTILYTGERQSMAFIGEETDVKIASSVWPWLVKHARRAARVAMDEGLCHEHISFVEGFSMRVLQRASEMFAEARRTETEEDERYLMVLDAKEGAIQKYMDDLFPNITNEKGKLNKGTDRMGLMMGAAEGDKVNLGFRQQLGGGGSERKLLS